MSGLHAQAVWLVMAGQPGAPSTSLSSSRAGETRAGSSLLHRRRQCSLQTAKP